MKKEKATAFLDEPSTKKEFLNTRVVKNPEEWIFFVGTFEAAVEPKPENDIWFVLAILKSTLYKHSEKTFGSRGGAVRICPGTISSSGNAHQSDDGTWLWDTD